MSKKSKPIWSPQPRQATALKCPAFEIFYGGAAGGGKILSLDGEILTPFGYKKCKDLKIGTAVNNPDGSIAEIIQLHPIQKFEKWDVYFHDGTMTTVTGGHLWLAWRARKGKKRNGRRCFGVDSAQVVETATLKKWLESARKRKTEWPCIPVAEEQHFNVTVKAKSKLDPYLLGYLLGDGTISENNITITSVDNEHMEEQFGKYRYTFEKEKAYRFIGQDKKDIISELRKLNLLGKKSHNKFIPRQYLYGSIECRYAILQGLLDTDGYADSRGQVYYCSISEQLAKDVAFLVRSLGGVAVIYKNPNPFYRDKNGNKVYGQPAYDMYIKHRDCSKLFRLERKKQRAGLRAATLMYKRVVDIEIGGYSMGRCITVSHPNGLYITNDFIVTHNSDFLLMDFTTGIKYGARHKGIIFRKTFPELEELLERARELYPLLGGHWKATERTWIFPGGANTKMRFLESDTDVHKYQGHQYTWIAFDELTNWETDYVYVYMMSRARSPHGIPVWMRAAANPGSVGHAWVRARFIDMAPPEHIYTDPITGLTRIFIPALLDDNLVLMKNDPGYENRLKLLPPHLYKALREGNWDVFVGQYFEEFTRDKDGEPWHVVKPFPLAPGWRRFASMDWGYSKPFSIGWWAVTHDGRFIRYREWYGCNPDKPDTGIQLQAKEVAERAWDMSAPDGCVDMVADPACWSKQGLQGNSIADTFSTAGWNMVKGNNDRLSGASRLHDLFKTTAHDGRPMILIFDTCHAFIRTIPLLVIDPKRPEDVYTRSEDHVYDETKYAILTRLGSHPHIGHHRNYEIPGLNDNWKRGQGPIFQRRDTRGEVMEREYNPLAYNTQ